MTKINTDKINADWQKFIAGLGSQRERNIIGKLFKAILKLVGTDWKAVDVIEEGPWDEPGDKGKFFQERSITIVFRRK